MGCCDDFEHEFNHGLGKFRIVGNLCTEQFCDFIKLSMPQFDRTIDRHLSTRQFCNGKELFKVNSNKDNCCRESGIVLNTLIQCDAKYEIKLRGRLTGNYNRIGCKIFNDRWEVIARAKETKSLPISNAFGEGCFTFHLSKDHNEKKDCCNCEVNIVIFLKNHSKRCSNDTNVWRYTCTSPSNNVCTRQNNLCVAPTPIDRSCIETGNISNMVYLEKFVLSIEEP